jgi:putative redox protein
MNVHVEGRRLRYVQKITVGSHVLLADEPEDVGGADAGPNPYELLLAALGTCAGITVQMYADRKQWPLEEVHVVLSWARVHAEDCGECDTEVKMVDGIEMEVSFSGDLSEVQRRRLTEIAGKCPVHRTLSSPIQIHTGLRA